MELGNMQWLYTPLGMAALVGVVGLICWVLQQLALDVWGRSERLVKFGDQCEELLEVGIDITAEAIAAPIVRRKHGSDGVANLRQWRADMHEARLLIARQRREPPVLTDEVKR